MPTLDLNSLRVPEGQSLDLRSRPTRIAPLYGSTANYKSQLADLVEQLSAQQQMLYANNRHAVLLIFQAMDAAGKDGVIRHVLSGINPQGCQVFSYQHPTPVELKHDFLWRTSRDLPERGRIGVFNRSYYEEVLIVRVHPEILQSEGVPNGHHTHIDEFWPERFRSILEHERHLHANGTRIVKFFLHLSKEEQRQRFLARIDDPKKNWKFSQADIEERRFWDAYQQAYQEAMQATSTEATPWYVVPADDKQNARLMVAKIVLSLMLDLKLRYPQASPERLAELKSIRKELAKSA